MTPESYSFGTRLAKRCDYYAFPRTGSHYLWACFTGLLDLVFFPNDLVALPEARQRAEELNPHAFYALRLREDGVPVQPVYINAAPNGVHGTPVAGHWPTLVLIRDPHPTIYSWYHTAVDRWGAKVDDRVEWMRQAYAQYRTFYENAWTAKAQMGDQLHLVRFEELQASAATLDRIVSFLGVSPKLKTDFVYWWTQFDRMTQAGPRSFYRGGNNERWRQDEGWRSDWTKARPGDFTEFGYSNPA